MNPTGLAAHRSEVVIADLISQPVLTVEVHESLWDAWQLLFVSGLRYLVVLNEDGSSRGILTDRSILAEVPATAENLGRRSVGDIIGLVRHATVGPRQQPMVAASAMAANAVEALPVVDKRGRVVGIVTESDIVRWLVS